MKNFTEKICQECLESFIPFAPAQLYCGDCQHIKEQIAKDKKRIEARDRYRRKQAELGRVITHGKGSANKCGRENSNYRNGISEFIKLKPVIKNEIRFCEICDKDLKDVSQYMWCIHHKDHNRLNNVRSNFQLLCKRCHQIEHMCWLAFQESAETISQESTPKPVEAVDIDKNL